MSYAWRFIGCGGQHLNVTRWEGSRIWASVNRDGPPGLFAEALGRAMWNWQNTRASGASTWKSDDTCTIYEKDT